MPYIDDAAKDAQLSRIAEADTLWLCSAEPSTYAEASSTYALGSASGQSFSGAVDGDGSGRKIAQHALTGGSITTSGTATHYALTVGSELLIAQELTSPLSVTAGQNFSLGSGDIEISDPWAPKTFPDYTTGDFTVIWVTDTQHYTYSEPEIGDGHLRWIKDEVNYGNLDHLNLVMHGGDHVVFEGNAWEWQRIDSWWNDYVESLGIPQLHCAGNHDYLNQDYTTRDLTTFNSYFPSTDYTNASWWNGGLETAGQTENAYQKITLGGETFIFFTFEYETPDAVMTWAGNVMDANPGAIGVYCFHAFLDENGNRLFWGQHIWDNFIDNRDDIYLVLCADEGSSTVQGYHRVDTNAAGRVVHQIFANYSDYPTNGGNGFLRLMRFVPSTLQVFCESYSYVEDAWMTGTHQEFNFTLGVA